VGFSEELSVELTKFDDLVVFDSMSFLGMSYSDTDKYELLFNRGIRFIVQGSVKVGNKQVKILVHLTDLNNHLQIWAERYNIDCTSRDLIDIQGDIALEIASIVGSEYGIILHHLSAEVNRIMPQKPDTYIAILKFHYFQAVHTLEAAHEAFNALEKAIASEPDSGIATALLSGMYFNRYMLDVGETDIAYQRMNELAERAVELDTNSLSVKIVCVMKHFANNDRGRFLDEVETCLKKNLNNSYRLGSLGMYLFFYGEWERGKKILDQVMRSNIQYPLFLLGPTMLYYYRKKDYKKSLLEANKYDVPFLFWGPMLRAAVLGQLNLLDEAKPNIAHLLQLKPEFETKARYLISRFVKEDELVEHVIEGLRKAGMKV
jgi:TolB-like protein